MVFHFIQRLDFLNCIVFIAEFVMRLWNEEDRRGFLNLMRRSNRLYRKHGNRKRMRGDEGESHLLYVLLWVDHTGFVLLFQ